jgi:hypothetical protein
VKRFEEGASIVNSAVWKETKLLLARVIHDSGGDFTLKKSRMSLMTAYEGYLKESSITSIEALRGYVRNVLTMHIPHKETRFRFLREIGLEKEDLLLFTLLHDPWFERHLKQKKNEGHLNELYFMRNTLETKSNADKYSTYKNNRDAALGELECVEEEGREIYMRYFHTQFQKAANEGVTLNPIIQRPRKSMYLLKFDTNEMLGIVHFAEGRVEFPSGVPGLNINTGTSLTYSNLYRRIHKKLYDDHMKTLLDKRNKDRKREKEER